MRPAHLPLMATLLFEGSVFSADSQESSRLRETVHTHLLARLLTLADPDAGTDILLVTHPGQRSGYTTSS